MNDDEEVVVRRRRAKTTTEKIRRGPRFTVREFFQSGYGPKRREGWRVFDVEHGSFPVEGFGRTFITHKTADAAQRVADEMNATLMEA